MEPETTLVRIKKIFSAPTHEMIKNYDGWANEYEKDCSAIGYQAPRNGADIMMRYLPDGEETKVLDVTCGTGLVGERIRSNGFKGTLHGVDGSVEMIKIARKKSLYDQIYFQYLVSGEKIVAESNDKYDGVTCIGGFLGGHLDPKILRDMADLVQTGGVLTYSARLSTNNDELVRILEEEECKLVERKVLERIGTFKTKHGVNWEEESQTSETVPTAVNIYCMRKL